MRSTLFRWAPAIGAVPRIISYYSKLAPLSYCDRLRFCNAVLGPDWMFRLQDIVGAEIISNSRPSWLHFYRDDIYAQHMPLDPRAPETDKYLGADTGAKEFAFYAGMGFEGYLLALRTPRRIDTRAATVELDGYKLSGVDEIRLRSLKDQHLTATEYYGAYGGAVNALFTAYETILKADANVPDELVEAVAAASLLFLCGGHQGCGAHIDEEEGQSVRREVIILCRYVKALAAGEIGLTTPKALSRAA